MMKTGRSYPYDTPPTNSSVEYVISPSDILQFKLYTNDGSYLVDFTALTDQQNTTTQNVNFRYLVEFDGQVKLPIIGRIE